MRKEVSTGSFVVVLIAMAVILLTSVHAAPPFCGDGNCIGTETCGSCPEDCGVCPPTIYKTEGAPEPIKLIPKTPDTGDFVKKGILSILTEAYEGNSLNPYIDIRAESDLFETVPLVNNFGGAGRGVYGASVTIDTALEKGEYSIFIMGEKETYDQEEIRITFDPTIYLNTSIKNNYFKGERIKFEGYLTYFDGNPVENATVSISAAGKNFSVAKEVISYPTGWFKDDYLVSFAEPDGLWDINIQAVDNDGNKGAAEFKTGVSTPEGVAFYLVTFLSPFKGSEFRRGEYVPVTVKIEEEGKLVKNANVNMRTPRGDVLTLKELAPATYGAEYGILPNDPLGEWYIAVEATKTLDNITKAGGNRIPINVRSALLNLIVLNPTSSSFFTGQKINIRTSLAYTDGTSVENAFVKMNIGNNSVILIEDKDRIYSGSYLFTEKDAKTGFIKFAASDEYGNGIELPEKPIRVDVIGGFELTLRLFYHNVLMRYWYVFAAIIILIIAATKPMWYVKYLGLRLKSLDAAEKRNLEAEKNLQRKYFKKYAMPRESYDKMMLRRKERASDLEEKKNKVQKILSKQKK